MKDPLFQFLFDQQERRPLTVSELNSEIRTAIEDGFLDVWVEGEVVGFLRASSGHWYFNLNDGTSQLKCVCWRGTNFKIRFRPENGITVRVRGRLTFWETKGELKLSVESLEPSGEGALRAAYDQIREKLECEGLFAPELKRPIPYFPRRVAVVTSRTGAAFHDISTVLTRRAKSVSILLVPAMVQGEGSADSIRRAIVGVNAYSAGLDESSRIDVLIVGRGGGSAEDLWAFNDESLARAIRASEIPVISAVGHEIDWTIADLISDLRAATPSAAAELVAGKEEDLLSDLQAAEATLGAIMEYKMHTARLGHEALDGQLQLAADKAVDAARTAYGRISTRLVPAKLSAKAAVMGHVVETLRNELDTALQSLMSSKREAVGVCVAKLDALSPLGVLSRGYSIAQTGSGEIVRDAAAVTLGDKLKIRLERGKLDVEVLSVE